VTDLSTVEHGFSSQSPLPIADASGGRQEKPHSDGPGNQHLAGRVALVAGGSGPVGKAVAGMLAAAGASVAVHYRSSAVAAEAIVAGLGTPAMTVSADFAVAAEVDAAFDAIEAEFGPVDVLVNASHASLPPTAFADLTDDQLTSQLDSVRGHAYLCRRALPGMRAAGWGRIVYVSGALMSRPAPGFAAYGAAKAAATTLTKYIALENGDAGITANVVAPGRVIDPDDDTPLTPTMAALAARLRERMALDFPDAGEVAGVIGLLVGPGSAPLTGQTLWVTGGEPIA